MVLDGVASRNRICYIHERHLIEGLYQAYFVLIYFAQSPQISTDLMTFFFLVTLIISW